MGRGRTRGVEAPGVCAVVTAVRVQKVVLASRCSPSPAPPRPPSAASRAWEHFFRAYSLPPRPLLGTKIRDFQDAESVILTPRNNSARSPACLSVTSLELELREEAPPGRRGVPGRRTAPPVARLHPWPPASCTPGPGRGGEGAMQGVLTCRAVRLQPRPAPAPPTSFHRRDWHSP